MITPADIENKEFSRSKKGYNEDEVDEFLDLIIVDMEKLIRENKQLKSELTKAHGQVDKHITTEASVYETLESAKQLMNDIAASSERRAEVILKNAELEANLITREAKENIQRYTDEGNRLRGRVESLKERYKKMLEQELERLDFNEEDILAEFVNDFLPASMTEKNEKEEIKIPVKDSRDVTTVFTDDQKKEIITEKVDLTKTMVY